MKLIRFGDLGHEMPGVILEDGSQRSAAGFGEDYDSKFFSSDGVNRLARWVAEQGAEAPVISSDARLGSPLAACSKIVCVGLNYAKHAAESGMDTPAQPVLFFKATSAIAGPFDKIIIPRGSVKSDWEVELGVVIGKRTSYVEESQALDHVAGYLVHNDVSEREFQLERGGQWVKGKSNDTFAPLGPWLVTKDEISDPQNLDLWLKINGETLQSSNTSDMVFGVAHLISYISQYMTLLPGDIISTGTPSGVGLGFDPPRFFQHGDVVELGVEGLGVSRQEVISYESTLGNL